MLKKDTITLHAVLLLLAFPAVVRGQYVHTVIPVGNLADVVSVTEFGKALTEVLDDVGGTQTLLFTGDIAGGSDPASAFHRIDTLIRLLSHEGRKMVFIPGDRDWNSCGQEGWEMVNSLEAYLRSLKREDILWPLQNGCPGPERVQLGLGLSLLVVNTQWWNHPYDKPTPESAMCEIATHEEAVEEIEKIIGETRFGNILIAGHYPVISGGEYGGHFPLGKWLFPVPVVSTMITSYRQNVGTPLHIANARYAELREDLEDILNEYPSLIHVSGHEACREIRQFHESILVQSGALTDAGYVERNPPSLYASAQPGLIVLHYDMDGNVRAGLYDWQEGRYVFDRYQTLLQAPCKTPMREVTINQRLVPCLEDRYVLPQMTRAYPEMQYISAGPQYQAAGLHKFLLGTHYRESWTTPISVPYLNLDTYANGLIPYLKGGGRQTKSLRMRGEDGREYVFRSVDKDPSRALSYNLRETLISLAVKDQTSTQHPYGAVVVSRLLDNTDILHPRPQVFLMPDDEKLGPFKEPFGNLLGMVEERPSGRKAVQHTFGDADEILSSNELFRKLYRSPKASIALDEYLQARVFDILVGDWSKHEENWKWAGFEQANGILYRPIPRDRDHVFSLWDGVLPWLVDREWAKPQGEHFGYRIKGLRSLMWQARHQDRFLTQAATKEDWIQAAAEIQQLLPDTAIDAAVSHLPEEVHALDNTTISAKLKARREDLQKYADAYYRMISTAVDVCGTNQDERFEAVRNADGSLDVRVLTKNDVMPRMLYHRTFFPHETHEVRLFGLQGDDDFVLKGKAGRSILVRVVPGSGENLVRDSSSVKGTARKTRVYARDNHTEVAGGRETRIVRIPWTEAYHYRRTAFAYHTYTPLMYIFSSSGNGIVFGGGVSFTRQAYDKPDYSAIHSLMLRVSTLGNLRFDYDGKLRHVLGMWDLEYGILLDKHQRLNYFFGTGNTTPLDPELLAADYYTLRYSALSVHGGLSRSFWERSQVQGFLTVIGTGRESMANNILEPGIWPDVAGNERLRVARIRLRCDLDFRDRPHLPERGMRFTWEGTAGKALNDTKVDYASTKATLEFFGTARPFTLGLKIGGAVHDGITPFFDFYYLGQNTHLRGFRQNRFTGKSLAFLNSELRTQLLANPRALIPFKLGLTLFFDTGQIFDRSDEGARAEWHLGYGAGLYFVPLRERFAIQISMGFSEEESGLLRFGIGQSF